MANRPSPSARIADIKATLANFADVWDDSQEDEQAWFAAERIVLQAELDALRTAVESAKAVRSWNRSAKRIAAEIRAFSNDSNRGHDARQAETARIRRAIDRAENSARNHGADKGDAANQFRAAVIDAREASAGWHRARAEQASAVVPVRELSAAERQYNDDIRIAFRR